MRPFGMGSIEARLVEMSASHVRTRDGTVGTIVVIDERDDGTVIILECEETEGDGVVIPSDAPDEDEYVYPLRRKTRERAAAHLTSPEPFETVLDTSEMPEGPLTFGLESFIEQAQRSAYEEQPVRLDEHTAEKFGYRADAQA